MGLIQIKDFCSDTLTMISSWRTPPEDKYTRGVLEGKAELEMQTTMLMTRMGSLMNNPEEVFDMQAEMEKCDKIRKDYQELKQLFDILLTKEEKEQQEQEEALHNAIVQTITTNVERKRKYTVGEGHK